MFIDGSTVGVRMPDGHCLGRFCIYIYFFKVKKKEVKAYGA
jgi:hypothetical protein